MTDPASRDAVRRRRRFWIAVTAALLGMSMVIPVTAVMFDQRLTDEELAAQMASAAPTSEAPRIKPLTVRPVIEAFVANPEDCPEGQVGPPTQTIKLCNMDKSAVFTLSGESVQLQLTEAESLLSPLSNAYFVQVSLTPESAQTFGDFTEANIGKQVAFVRGDQVVSAPAISQRLDGTTLQLSGELTEEESETMARLLRDDA
jgi:preprotein translocase subunit SecD